MDGLDFVGSAAGDARHGHLLLEPAFPTHHVADPGCLARTPLAGREDIVEGIADLAVHAGPLGGQALGEVTVARSEQGHQRPLDASVTVALAVPKDCVTNMAPPAQNSAENSRNLPSFRGAYTVRSPNRRGWAWVMSRVS